MTTRRDCPLCQPGSAPNPETLAAMRELEEGRGPRCDTVEELMADLNSDDDQDEEAR
jgi:hypothetical protein